MTNLQGSLWYHAAEPTRQVATDVINFLRVLSGGTVLAGVWSILYYVNSTAFTFTFLSALLLHTSRTVFNNKVCTRAIYINCVYESVNIKASQGVYTLYLSNISFTHYYQRVLIRLGDLRRPCGGDATARTCIM